MNEIKTNSLNVTTVLFRGPFFLKKIRMYFHRQKLSAKAKAVDSRKSCQACSQAIKVIFWKSYFKYFIMRSSRQQLPI